MTSGDLNIGGILSIRLQNFRSHRDASFEFDPGINIIVGPNASGKTNILEAILLSRSGSSYRAIDQDLINKKAKWSRLDVTGHKSEEKRIIKLTTENNKVKKQFTINGNSSARLKPGSRQPTVLFEPDHLQMLSGNPEKRRDYIDDILEQINSEFGLLRRAYKRTLTQRNALLKSSSDGSSLFAWNVRLSEIAGQLVGYRLQIIDKINNLANDYYQKLSHSKSSLVVEYKSSIRPTSYSSNMLKKLEQNLDLDRLRGFTGVGPHRDDMSVSLNGNSLNQTASRGESRTTLLVLKQIEIVLLEDSLGQKPVLLLDDVFSELDGARRQALTNAIEGYQTFITTTDADVVVQHFMDHCHIIAL